MRERTYGAELEKPVSDLETGKMRGVSQGYFDRLARAAKQRGDQWRYHKSDVDPEINLGVVSNIGEQGLDNGFNLLETALSYKTNPRGLEQLRQMMELDLKTVQEALLQEGATVINMSIHPLGSTDKEAYKTFVAPKGIYPLAWARGVYHAAGIDAKAQNSPTTGVAAREAAGALSVTLGFGSAFIGIFGNSPIANGEITKDKEYRLRLWQQMMKSSSSGDQKLARFPDERFYSLRDYFEWIYGEKTDIWFVIHKGKDDYKGGGSFVTIDDKPSVLGYLAREQWQATVFADGQKVTVEPHLSHMEVAQFLPFAIPRIRFGMNHDGISTSDFLSAMKENAVEALFENAAKYIYIEGRDPGANFPDRELIDAGGEIARSVMIAPSAIQAGLVKNLNEATALLDQYSWPMLGKLREAAIKDGLQGEVNGETVGSLTRKVLEVASRGLELDEQWMLSYPQWVLETGKNGADRALQQLGDNTDRESIRKLVLSRSVLLP